MILNFNIGILGHVDSGKTTLAKALSTQASTAAFDKHPESQQRGITIDLGFSSLTVETPNHLKTLTTIENIQITFVDCPGHASLIRTIIGGAQIIDLMLLVVDAQKGFQTQTSECLVIGELTCKKLIVIINKIDAIEEAVRDKVINKLKMKIQKIMETTHFGKDVTIASISALKGINIQNFIEEIKSNLFIPNRSSSDSFLFYVDHCFPIKGQGTVCTGTVIQGKVSVQETIEIPLVKEQKKVKSIQMFKKSVTSAQQGDRIGICLTQFNSDLMERGILAAPGYVSNVYAGIIQLNKIKYFKNSIKSKSKFHISIGHETVMAKILLFRKSINDDVSINNQTLMSGEYEYVEEINTEDENSNKFDYFILLEFDGPVLTTLNALLIASKLDIDIHTNACRLAFWGRLIWLTMSNSYITDSLTGLKIFKNKLKQGNIQRVVNDNEVIVQNLFKKESKRDIFVGKKVTLSTGEEGMIESTFGQTSKVKIRFMNGLQKETLSLLKSNKSSEVLVFLKFKKYLFDKNKRLEQ